MDKVEKVFTLIYNNSKLKEELIKKQTMDEMYEYCTSISGGYTREEFDKFVNEMCQYVKEELTNKNLSISDEDMKKVSGGTQLKNKAISSLLAAMTISTPLVGAASNNQENTDIPVESKTSITQKIKDFVSKNPITTGVTATGIPIMVILGMMLRGKNKDNAPKQDNNRRNAQPIINHDDHVEPVVINHDEPPVIDHDEPPVVDDRHDMGIGPHAGVISAEEDLYRILNRRFAAQGERLAQKFANINTELGTISEANGGATRAKIVKIERAIALLRADLQNYEREMPTRQQEINEIQTAEIKDRAQTGYDEAELLINTLKEECNRIDRELGPARRQADENRYVPGFPHM